VLRGPTWLPDLRPIHGSDVHRAIYGVTGATDIVYVPFMHNDEGFKYCKNAHDRWT
jgi:hypothetical protein